MISQYPAPPPPESLRDTGQVDGIPVRTMADVEREQRERFARIAAVCGRVERYTADVPEGTRVTLYALAGGKPMPFPSMKAAARAVGVNPANISNLLRKCNYRLAGFVWKVNDALREADQ